MTSKNNKNSQEAYFTLRAEHVTGSGTRGRQLMAGAGIIHIGQTADCEWHLDNTTPYVDEVYAVIRPSQLSGEWVLVPTSEHVSVSVNGNKVSLIHYLRDGDIISFDGERLELRFNVHQDGRYNSDIGVAYIPIKLSTGTKLSLGIIAAVVIACLFWVGIYLPNIRQKKVNKMLQELSSSVYQITVDTVFYVATSTDLDGTKRDSILGWYSYKENGGDKSGTAFIADDTLLITARHCIEPWITDPAINGAVRPSDLPDGPVRWAFEAETVNQLNSGKDSLHLISKCTVRGGPSGDVAINYTSDDFYVNRDRDDIIEKGDFNEDYYWRSIQRRKKLTIQTLGDVAFTISKTNDSSNLHLGKDEYRSFETLEAGRDLYFLGYPNYEGKGFETQKGTLKKDYKGNELLWHDGAITYGYSGGPVLVINGNWITGTLTATVVGVISQADSKGNTRTYSVPVNEINKQIIDRR